MLILGSARAVCAAEAMADVGSREGFGHPRSMFICFLEDMAAQHAMARKGRSLCRAGMR